MHLGGLHFQYLHICPRKAWLKLKGIESDPNHETVGIGRALNRPFAAEEKRGASIAVDSVRGKTIIERKRTNRELASAVAQVNYYLWLHDPHCREGWTGRIEGYDGELFHEAGFTPETKRRVEDDVAGLITLASLPHPPPLAAPALCARCGFNTFCLA